MDPGEKETCPFCNPPREEVVAGNELAYAKWDKHPVTEGHVLIIPKRHFADYFDMTGAESGAVDGLLKEMKQRIEGKDPKVEGFNVARYAEPTG
jgi:diadenosine tetraphosphate (Ap4A) HIT family hydrolase